MTSLPRAEIGLGDAQHAGREEPIATDRSPKPWKNGRLDAVQPVSCSSGRYRLQQDIGHPATTPYDVAAWWVKYLLPQGGVLLDCFAGSGTMLAAGLDFGASQVIGIEQQKKYLKDAEKRIVEG